MDRRTFIWTLGSLSTIALLAGSTTILPNMFTRNSANTYATQHAKPTLKGKDVTVSVAWLKKRETPDIAFQSMINHTTDFSWLSKGDRVLIKLSLNAAAPYPATSDPWTLRCLIQTLKERGAGEILVGDQSGVHSVHWTRDRQRGGSRECCRIAGLLDVIENNGAKPCFFEERGYDSYISTLPEGEHHWKEPIYISNVVNEVDHIIYLARVSSHIISDLTSGLKIGVGFLREDSRRLMHSSGDDFFALYEEINEVPEIKSKLRFTISSGRSVITLWGPDNGYITEPDYGAVFASENVLAHELFAYAWLQYNREKLTPGYLYNLEQEIRGLVNLRSRGNRSFVNKIWKTNQEIPDIPFYQPGKIYQHPSIVNSLLRLGGSYNSINVKEVVPNPDVTVREYLQKQIMIS